MLKPVPDKKIGPFYVPPTTTFYESKFPEKVQTRIIKCKTYYNRKLASIRIVFV